MKKIGLICVLLFLIIVANDMFNPTATFGTIMVGLTLGVIGVIIIAINVAFNMRSTN